MRYHTIVYTSLIKKKKITAAVQTRLCPGVGLGENNNWKFTLCRIVSSFNKENKLFCSFMVRL